jgi:O-antigen/teichoic acid export membrane protein
MSNHRSPESDPHSADLPALEIPPPKVKRAGIIARLLHGTGAGAVAYGLGIGSNLLLLPLYLRFWSVAVYGEWMALYSVVNYLANLDFGVTTAAVNAATMAYARKDWPAFKRIQGTAWAASLAIAGLGGAVVATLSLFYFRVNRWLGLTVINQHDARLVFCSLAIALLANIPGRQLIAVYIAIGKFATYQWLYNAFALFSVVVAAVALSVGARPVALGAVGAGTTLLMIAFAACFLSWQGSGLMPRIRDADWRTARMLAAPTGQFGISMIATALTVQGPIVVLSRVLGGPAVALFATTRTVANVVRGMLALLRAPLGPEFSATSAQPNKDALRRLFRVAVSIDAIIAISLTAVLWSGGVWLIRFWSHGRIVPDPMLLHLLLVAFMLEGFLQMLTIAGWATNRFQAVSLGQLATAGISLILAVVLLGRFGISAIPLATIVPLIAIMMPLSVQNARNEAHLTLRYVIGRLLIPFVFLISLCAVFPAWIASFSLSSTWLSAGISFLATCALATFTVAAVFLTRDDRMAVRDRTNA